LFVDCVFGKTENSVCNNLVSDEIMQSGVVNAGRFRQSTSPEPEPPVSVLSSEKAL
jgi:hypothetical protein